ncbi:MAG: DoxX family protein [Actinomycetota bacterium]
MQRRERTLWILQWVFGVYFVVVGVTHLIVPEGLPGPMSWMYDLDGSVHAVAGTAEILGGVGLLLPGLTRILPWLTSFAALGLVLVMLGAVIWHSTRGEITQIITNIVIATVLGYVASARWKLFPLRGTKAGAAPSQA